MLMYLPCQPGIVYTGTETDQRGLLQFLSLRRWSWSLRDLGGESFTELLMRLFVRMFLMWVTCLVSPCITSGMANETPSFSEESLDFFEKEVRPLLVKRCYECHSSDQTSPRGGLTLDSRTGVLTGGDTGPAVVLEKPAESLFLSSINYGDLYQMPPKSKLPAEEIEILTKWVELGLPWPPESASGTGVAKPFDVAERKAAHWCWQPVTAPPLPDTGASNWPLTDTDRFILAKLQSRGLSPAPSAEKRALLRRIYFDLIGLPPSPEEVEQFVQDSRPNALELVVDRLLDSAHFGERWGRHWLDLARFAETRGHEFEPIIPNAWQYRDYVIRAFNADVPYDRFLTEQIAGDLISPRWRATSPSPSGSELPINESVLGTGFWFLGEEVHSPVDIRKDETDRIDNRLDVLTKTFLGLTVACARCHDHKFDAISQKDYYALAGFALSGSYRQMRVDTEEQHQRIAQTLDERRSRSRQQVAQDLVTLTRPALDQLDRSLLAAVRTIDAGFSSKLAPGADPGSLPDFDLVKRTASETQLDPRMLAGWCAELIVARDDVRHPLHGLTTANPLSAISGGGEAPVSSTPAGTTASPSANYELIVDFGDPAIKTAPQDGVSFGLKPQPRGQLVLSTATQSHPFHIDTVGGWNRDLFWKEIRLSNGTEVDNGTLGAWQQYGRMVRTPEFSLQKRNLWYLVRGSVRAYAAVNSHLIVVGPLHGGLLREYKHADNEWHWVSHDLSLYPGHRMHIEFSPADDGPLTIAMVVASDDAPKLPEPPFFHRGVLTTAGQPVAERVAAYAEEFRVAASLLAKEARGPESDSAATDKDVDASRFAPLANWLVTHLSLFAPQDSLSLIHVSDDSTAEAELAKNVRWESGLAPAMLEGNGVDEYLLVRGNSSNPKDLVPRRFLEALQPHDLTASQSTALLGSGRLELAREILDSPLAARVAVNRIWHHLFGRGLVPSVDNFGVLGLPPTHPELLDYLADQFVRNGWSTKGMIRSLILSRTYQMSSRPTDADALDPNNELWHRMAIRRLQGEVIRDSLLAVSGRLDPTLYGPSVPIHLTEFMQGRGRPGMSGPLDGNGRRSIYISVRRNFLSPMMLAFDTPSPFSTVGRRTVSNVPAQALILMNDPFVIEQAQLWAGRLLAEESATTRQRLDRLYQMAFARLPSESEAAEAAAFLESQGAAQPENQRQAWSHLCHVMFNVKEFVYID